MEETATLTKWLSDYPAITDPNFAGRLAEQVEFAELASTPDEPPPKPGESYSHQELFKRMYDVFDRVLVMDDPGTGKTCLVAALTEHLKRQWLANSNRTATLLSPPLYKRAYVLGKGPIIEENFKNEIACRCTQNIYDSPEMARLTELAQRREVTKRITEYYQISTYRKFARQIHSLSDEQLVAQFEGSVFIIDESHNLIPHTSATEIVDREEARLDAAMEAALNLTRAPRSQLNVREVYEDLKRLFRVVRRCKVIEISATPARASAVYEFASQINLLRPADDQMPSEPADMPLADFSRWLSGYTVYVRALDTGVDFVFTGETIAQAATQIGAGAGPVDPTFTSKLYPVQMSGIQAAAYTAAYAINGSNNFYSTLRQANNLVYPDGTYGKEGYDRYIYQMPGNRFVVTQEFAAGLEYARQYYPDNPIYMYSAKFAQLYTLVKYHHERGEKGFVYQELKEGSGVIALAALMEYMGIERFYPEEPPFRGGGSGGSYCGLVEEPDLGPRASAPGAGPRVLGLTKKLRFGLLIPDNPVTVDRWMLEVFNSPENAHGEYIAALFMSPVGREGISFQDIQWTAENPAWLWPLEKQSIYRGRRATSQVRLLREARLLNPTARLNMYVYHLAAWTPDVFSIDLHMAREAETTARRNAPYITQARAVTNNCYLAYARNVRPGDDEKAGTPDCDYGSCVYQCVSEPPRADHMDYSGLIRKYSVEYRGQVVGYLRNLATQRVATPLTRVVADLTALGIAQEVALVELNRVLDSRAIYINRFGQRVYYHLSTGFLLALPEYPNAQKAADMVTYVKYTEVFPTVLTQSLARYFSAPAQTQFAELLPLLQSPYLVQEAQNLPADQVTYLFEQSFDRWQRQDPITNYGLITYYQPKYFGFWEPLDQIRAQITKLKGSRSQHAPLPPAPVVGAQPEYVYVHTLASLGEKLTRYANATRSTKPENIRIYSPSRGWRTANWVETEVYQQLIDDAIRQREAAMIANRVYGFEILGDPKQAFYIIRDAGRNTAGGVPIQYTDKRQNYRGRVCETLPWGDMASVLQQVGLQVVPNDPTLTPPEVDRILLEENVVPVTGTYQERLQLASFVKAGKAKQISKTNTCNLLHDHLQALGLLAVR